MKLRCTVCREAFSWEPSNGWPKHCPCCGEYIGTDGKEEVVLPFIRKSTAISKTADRVYRNIESDSEHRQEMAADMLGVSKSEVSDIKITNMRDGMREGDAAVVQNLTPVQSQMAAGAVNTREIGLQASQFVRQGPLPGAGTIFIQNTLKPSHTSNYGVPTTDNPSIGVRK